MNAAQSLPADPVALVRQLDAEVILNRIDELDREREALVVLLRAARCTRPDGDATRHVREGVPHGAA